MQYLQVRYDAFVDLIWKPLVKDLQLLMLLLLLGLSKLALLQGGMVGVSDCGWRVNVRCRCTGELVHVW